mgnify:CR=1 FL=1
MDEELTVKKLNDYDAGKPPLEAYLAASSVELLKYLWRGVSGEKAVGEKEQNLVLALLSERREAEARKTNRLLCWATWVIAVFTLVLALR